MNITKELSRKITSLSRRIITRLMLIMIDKAIAPTTQQKGNLIEDIKRKLATLPNVATQADMEWNNNMNRLYELLMNDDIRSFLRWDVIQRTMFVTNAPYVKNELNYLRNLADWEERWSRAIIESTIGHPLPSIFYPKSSGNLIHHAYHLAQFEEKTGLNINKFDFVFEFGGGYGSMCRLFHNLGFIGNYVIFDLPPFSALQEYYLKALSLPVRSISFVGEKQNSIVCLSNAEVLKEIWNPFKIVKTSKNLFLATWSLSESPMELRGDLIVPLLSNFNNVLIGYSGHFGGVDNVQYFNKFRDNFIDMIWHNWEINHLPGNYYLIGNSQN